MRVERIEGTYGSNTYIIFCDAEKHGTVIDEDIIIIDSGALLEDIEKAVGSGNVLGVFITHEHFDHMTFACDYARKFQCPIYCSRETLTNFEYFKNPIEFEGKSYRLGQYGDDTKIILIKDESEIELGKFVVKPFWTAGHSFGGISFLIENGLFCGDTLFKKGIGRYDAMSHGKKYMIESLKKIGGIKFEKCFHGHGDESDYFEQMRNIKVFTKWLEKEQ
ncbi:MAG: MBL fold metallo-hydrolase [Christensenellaceae bacterium]|jgi:glyoxylase-like metal-dependent hydrolase (beta-lactamase superfamily II)|nr:MBL fold metallo-hydrolase [Christensenellaceae bacterium]